MNSDPKETSIFVAIFVFSALNIALVTTALLHLEEHLGIISALAFTVSAALASPIINIYRDLEEIEEAAQRFLKNNIITIKITVVIGALTSAAFFLAWTYPGSGIVNLSFQASATLFFPIKLSLSEKIGGLAADIIYNYSRLYIHFAWIYFFSGLFIDIKRKVSSYFDRGSEDYLYADLIPFRRSGDGGIKAEVYVATGRHGLIRIPESFCKECNLFVNAVQKASEQVDAEVSIQIKSYWTRFMRPLLKGGHHPPVLLINGELYSQGYQVPDKDELADELRSIQNG
jgi:hypothetical protein